MLLCPYCSFSNPETATHCLGCGNDLPPASESGLGSSDLVTPVEAAPSTPSSKSSPMLRRKKRRGSFVSKDDQEVLGDMDAALDTLLRQDLSVGKLEESNTSDSSENSPESNPTRMVSTPRGRSSHEDIRRTPYPTGSYSSPAQYEPHTPTTGHESTAISPVDPKTWKSIVQQTRQAQALQAPESPSIQEEPTDDPRATTARTEAPTLPRPPMIHQTARYEAPSMARTSSSAGSVRKLHKPETTEKIDLNQIRDLLHTEKTPNRSQSSDAASSTQAELPLIAPKPISPPPAPSPNDTTPHQPEQTDRMQPGEWADIALARINHTPKKPRSAEDVEELGLESIVDEEEEELTVADGEKLAQLRNGLMGSWQMRGSAAPDTAVPASTAPYTSFEDIDAPTPSEVRSRRAPRDPEVDPVDLDEHDHTLGAAPLSAETLRTQDEDLWALQDTEKTTFPPTAQASAQNAPSSDEHTLVGPRRSSTGTSIPAPLQPPPTSTSSEQNTERWFENAHRDRQAEEAATHHESDSTLHGAAPPIVPPPATFHSTDPPTQKNIQPATTDGTSTYLFVVLDVEAPRGEKVLRKSKRLQALEGLTDHLAESMREIGLAVEERRDDRLVSRVDGSKRGVMLAIQSARRLIEEVNRYDTPVAARIRVRCVISTVTDAIEHPHERASTTATRLLRGMPVDRIWLDWTSYCTLQDPPFCQEVLLPSLEEPAYEIEGTDAPPRSGLEDQHTQHQSELHPLWIGRQREQEALHHHFHASKNANGRIVLLLGPPGSGRSRLLQEFLQHIQQEALFFLGSSLSCPSEANTSPYLAGLLQSHLSQHQIERHKGLSQHISTLHTLTPPFPAPRIAQLLLELSSEGPPNDDGQTEEAFSWYIRACTSRMPVVLIFDDLFLLERRTHRLLDSLLQQPPSNMLLVLVSTPGEYEEILFSSLSQAHRIEIPPLTTTESRQLIDQLRLPNDVNHKQIDRMIEEAEGNPKLLLTLAQAIFTRSSNPRDLTWSYDLAVPNAVERLMLQRQRGLTHLEKDTLRKASVIGDRFWQGAVECLERLDLNDGSWGLREGVIISSVDDRTGCLRQLEEKEIIQKVPHSSLPYEKEYRFPHRLLRRILVRQIPLSIRQQMHRHVAHWLSLRDEAHLLAFEIARHLKLAGDPEGAAWRLFESAQEVLQEQRYTQALSLLAEALETLAERNPVLRLRLLFASAEAYFHVGDLGAAQQLYETALQLSWRLTSAYWGGRIFCSLSRCSMLRGEFQKAQGHILDAQTLAKQVDDTATLQHTAVHGLYIPLIQGETEEADKLFPEVRAQIAPIRETTPLLWAELQALEGWNCRLKHQWRESIKHLQEAAHLRKQYGDLAAYAASLTDQAEFYFTAGDEDSATPFLDEAIELLRQRDAYRILQKALLLNAHIALSRRDTQKAIDSLREAWQHSQLSDDPSQVAQIAAALAATYVLTRQPNEAAHFAQIAIQRLKDGSSVARATTYFFLGEAAAGMTPEQLNTLFNPPPPRLPEGGMPTFLFLKAVELFKRAKEAARQISTLLSLGRSLLIGGFNQTATNVIERGIADANRVGLGLLLERLRNQRRLLSSEDPPESPARPRDASQSTLVVRKARQSQSSKPFASETQSHPAPASNPAPAYSSSPSAYPPTAPPNVSNPFQNPAPSEQNQRTNILPSPQRSGSPRGYTPRNKEKP